MTPSSRVPPGPVYSTVSNCTTCTSSYNCKAQLQVQLDNNLDANKGDDS